MDNINDTHLDKHFSPISIWALSFGCAVGWGAFVMPGTTFLPIAGPVGSILGLGIGAFLMFIIGVCYAYMIKNYPGAGGTFSYVTKVFGYDHGFLCAWFLLLVYVAIIWANASALTLIGRNIFGDFFQFGFHYNLLGYDIYMGEAILAIEAIILFGFICAASKRLASVTQVIFALILLCGVVLCFAVVTKANLNTATDFKPPFAISDNGHFYQVFKLVALAPWAFVGFESICHSSEEYNFSHKKIFGIFIASVISCALCYIMLTVIAVSVHPMGYTGWAHYIRELGSISGYRSIPVLYAIRVTLGRAGIAVFGFVTLAGIITGLIGNFIAASRLMFAMSRDKLLPEWFGVLDKNNNPRNAFTALILISVFVPFLGRTAIGWIVDVTSIGATIAYAYASAASFFTAKEKKNSFMQLVSAAAFVIAIIFFMYFMAFSSGAMATESYLLLAAWSILGFVFFRYLFSHDETGKLGKSFIVWLGLTFLIFFTSLMWVRQANTEMTDNIVNNIRNFYEQKHSYENADTLAETEMYLMNQMSDARDQQVRNSYIQMALIIISLIIMFNVYNIMTRRNHDLEVERYKAEESSKAKSTFLSNMSHDIRTPMNAIIGYIHLAEDDSVDLPKMREYMAKIKTSSNHLLALINDVLEMSRIESGRMDLEPIAINLRKTFAEIRDMFSTQMSEKNIDFNVDYSEIKRKFVYCDKNRFNRVLLNLLSNAYKFTPNGGSVLVSVWEIDNPDPSRGVYEIRVKDSGIGMSEEFAKNVFEAFEREQTSTVSGIEGTGLGMAITKSIIDLMQGSISVVTAPGEGTEFIIKLAFDIVDEKDWPDTEMEEEADESETGTDFSGMRLLLVDDVAVNREIAVMILSTMGFVVDTAENGQEAVDTVSASEPGYYRAVLMDIQMPVMDGYEATRTIRALDNKQLASLPIIAMTANAFAEDVKKAKDAGMDAHLAKPLDLNDMTVVLQKYCGGGKAKKQVKS